MYKINNQTKSIKLIRGDSFAMPVRLWVTNPEAPAERYQLMLGEGDRLTFTVKESAYHQNNAVQKVYTSADCGTDGVIPIELAPEDTESLEFGGYRYDLELFFGGKTDTIIVSDFELAEEITGGNGSGDFEESSVTVEVMPVDVIDFEVMPSTFSGEDGHSPYIGEDGFWYQWDDEQKCFVNTGVKNPEKLSELENDCGFISEEALGAELAKKADKNHTHSEYLTEAEAGELIPEIDDTASGADSLYSSAKLEADFAKKSEIPAVDVDKAYVDGALEGKAEADHTHSQYLTEQTFPTVSAILILSVEGWAENTQTVAVALDTAKRNVIDVMPESLEMWAKSGVYATAETAEGITFVCAETPTSALLFRVTSEEVSYVS